MRGQRARDRDALLLAARELGRTVAGAIREADHVEQLGDPVLVDVAACKTKRQRDVLGGRERRQQVVGLEDEADAIAPQLRELALAQTLEGDAVDGALPAVGCRARP